MQLDDHFALSIHMKMENVQERKAVEKNTDSNPS